jgi:hypothetical protein
MFNFSNPKTIICVYWTCPDVSLLVESWILHGLTYANYTTGNLAAKVITSTAQGSRQIHPTAGLWLCLVSCLQNVKHHVTKACERCLNNLILPQAGTTKNGHVSELN